MLTTKNRLFALALSVLAAAALLAPVPRAEAAPIVITPDGTGTASGSLFANIAGMFDAQPASIPVVGNTTDAEGNGYTINNDAARRGYIDFGADYADITLQNVYILIKQFGTSDNPTSQTYYWSSDTNAAFEAGDVLAPNLNLFTNSAATSDKQWTLVWSGSEAVQQRYLIVGAEDTTSNRIVEVALVGEVVPEPASLALLGMGGFLLMGRRGV